ncbi:unnamed protein product [Blepharisma stoltei]|uniref:C2H2-type domain-containing protein n=1 Tax=Blepharisma stoltei TaxID=1481888 RepID=A0AAU9INW2_9CILI|nr:unnamed protein product [Blepharisma stoltei]
MFTTNLTKYDKSLRLPSPKFLSATQPLGSSTFACTSCCLSFCLQDDLTIHQGSSHGSKIDTLCTVKGQDDSVFSLVKMLLDAKLDHPKTIFKCRFCDLTFRKHKGLKQHVGKIHLTKNKNARCPHCTKRFRHKYAVRFHVKQVHTKTTRVVCEECGKVMYNKYLLVQHAKVCSHNH